MKYELSLILSAPEIADEEVDKLYDASCDDPSILTREGVARV